MSFKVEPVGDHVSSLGEGPHWDEKSQVLYHVDAFVGDVWKIDLKNNKSESINLGDLVTIVIPFADGDDLLVSLRNKVVRLNWKTYKTTKKYVTIAEVGPERHGKERFNDGKIDAKGRLWIGTVLEDDDKKPVAKGGALYRLDHDKFTKVSEGYTIANGMDWSTDNKKFYFNDSEDRKTWVFDFDLEKGTISNKKLLIDSDKNSDFKQNWYQDGMTVDKNGKIWTALYGGGRVFQINPENGKVENVIEIPAIQSSSVFFGGQNYDELYVTTGNGSIPENEKSKYPNAGKVFRVTSDKHILLGAGSGRRFKPTQSFHF